MLKKWNCCVNTYSIPIWTNRSNKNRREENANVRNKYRSTCFITKVKKKIKNHGASMKLFRTTYTYVIELHFLLCVFSLYRCMLTCWFKNGMRRLANFRFLNLPFLRWLIHMICNDEAQKRNFTFQTICDSPFLFYLKKASAQ